MSGALPPGSQIPEVEDIDGIDDNVRDKPISSTETDKINLFGPVLKGIGYMTNFGGGILDIAVAGMGLDAALKNGNAMDKAAASLGVVSGAGFTGAGAAEIAGATISPGARFAPLRALGAVSRLGVVPGLNVVGVVVGAVSLILGLVIQNQKNKEKEEEVRSDFEDLDSYGVMEEDWGEKLNFLIHSAAAFEGEEGAGDAPDYLYYDDGFYDDNKDVIDHVIDQWGGDKDVDFGERGGWRVDNWTGDDDIVSKSDLKEIVESDKTSDMDKKAAQFLLDNEGFLSLLDTFHNGGEADNKVSSADIDSWMQFIGERPVTEDNPIFEREDSGPLYDEFFSEDVPIWEAQPELYKAFTEEVEENGNIPENFFENHLDTMDLQIHGKKFYQDNKKVIDTIAEHWDDWNGGDDLVGKDNLRDIRDDDSKSKAEQEAAAFLLDDKKSDSFYRLLDVFHEGGDTDGRISDADLDSWFQIIGERPITEDNPVFEFEDDDAYDWVGDHKGP